MVIKIVVLLIIFLLAFSFFFIKRNPETKNNYQERLIFYLGEELYNKNTVNINNYPGIIDINNFKESNHKGIKPNFDVPLNNILTRTNNNHKKFSYQPGDVWTGGVDVEDEMPSEITFVKNRDRFDNKGVILKCLDLDRHWGLYYNKPKDIPFDNKKDVVIWRGVTTGQLSNPGNRFDLVKRWYNVDPSIDIGFNNIVQEKGEYKKFMKLGISPQKMLEHKYIISVEGNDKDSGLNWKLNSNSLVLMPKPLSTTWLMERKLIPNYHYVLLNNDFSDLKEKLEWCRGNQDTCKVIIKNANEYMDQFKDIETENNLEEDVVKLYFEKVK